MGHDGYKLHLEARLAEEYLYGTLPLHPRRTLDQFYYSHLPDTSERDGDQTVTRMTAGDPGGPKLIMVDQLWMWIIDESKDENFWFYLHPRFRKLGSNLVGFRKLISSAM
jgi:hypothetical protein